MINSALLPYSPRLFQGFTITHERDGYWRIYSGVIQRGWARRLKDAKRLIREDSAGLQGIAKGASQ